MAMHTKKCTAAWLLSLAVTVPGLASMSTQEGGTSGSGPTSSDACFNINRVHGFSPLHEKFVYVQVGNSEHYLLTLDRLPPDAERPLLGRPLADVIEFAGADFFGRVCSNMTAAAAFIDSGDPAVRGIVRLSGVYTNLGATAAYMDSGRPVLRRVVRVEAVADKEAAQKLVEERTTARPKG